MYDLGYCERCGTVIAFSKAPTENCPVCGFMLRTSTYSVDEWEKLSVEERSSWIEDHIIHDGETAAYAEKRKKHELTVQKIVEAGADFRPPKFHTT